MYNESILKAISWTLIHSIWQGVILTLLAGLIIIATKKATAHFRYNSLLVLFSFFIACVGITYAYEYNSAFAPSQNTFISTINYNLEKSGIITPSNYFQTAAHYINRHALIVVMIWMFIVCIRLFGFSKNIVAVYKIRNYGTQDIPQYWKDNLLRLSQKLNIKQNIKLVESRLVTIPSVTGFFKPMILLPVGLLSNLPPDQVEAILLHELAHIKRNDYFVNLLQSFIETLFFFNPGVLWVSSLIKTERENCCDDIALGILENKSKFIQALISFQEYSFLKNNLAMELGNNKKHLLERAKRIIDNQNKTLDTLEKIFLSLALITFITVVVACSNDSETLPLSNNVSTLTKHKPLPENGDAYIQTIINELLKDKIIKDQAGLSYKLSTTELIVSGTVQPEHIHKKFKAKFLRTEGITATYYNYDLEADIGL